MAPEHQHQAIIIMRLLAFNPLMFAISGIVSSVQQSYGRFFFYAVSSLFYNVVIIASIFIFRNNLGIVGVGIGAMVGGLVQLAVSLLGLVGLGYKYYPKVSWRNDDFRKVLHQLPPRSLDQGIDQVNGIVEVNRAQALGTGPVTWYNYATTLYNVPIMLLGNAIATAAFPRLNDRLSQKRPDLFRKDFLTVLRVIIWLTAPVVVITYFCRGYLARIIFADNAPQVATLLGFLSAAIFFRIIYTMISRYFYAYKDTKTPLFVSIFAIALNIVLAFALVHKNTYGVAGLAIAQSLVAASEVILLFGIMVIRDPKLIDRKFWSGVAQILSVTGFTTVTAYVMLGILPLQAADRGFFTLGSKLVLISATILVVHVLVSNLFELEEGTAVIQKAKRIILRPIRVQ
jgi:putative peptidoglycan lipid II flippase